MTRLAKYHFVLAAFVLAWLPLNVLTHLTTQWDFDFVRHYLSGKSEVVYFGDSVIDATDNCEVEKRTVIQFAGEFLGRPILPVHSGGMSLIVWRKMARFMAAHPRGQVAVIPINLRSFS